MRPGSKRCSALLLASFVGVGCARSAPPATSAPSDASADANERRAPGVAETHALALPEPVLRGDSGDQLLLLRAPPGTERARGTVRDFLRAAVNESPERLEALLSKQAYVTTGNGRQPARAFWQLRFAQLDYTELKGQLLFRDGDLQTYRVEDIARLPPARRPPLELSRDEIAVRVPIHVSWNGRTRLFGDELLFRLQPARGSFEITEISEDFRLP